MPVFGGLCPGGVRVESPQRGVVCRTWKLQKICMLLSGVPLLQHQPELCLCNLALTHYQASQLTSLGKAAFMIGSTLAGLCYDLLGFHFAC